MADFKSTKQEPADKKTRAGTRPNKAIKSSDFIPKTFRTPVNVKWLNSTLDQMISKGDLESIEGVVGGSAGSALGSFNDVYINTGSEFNLEPAIVSRDAAGNIDDHISVDDIAKSIKFNFDNYSYNAAYSTQAYVFAPPIDIDKFLNYSNYYWVPSLPTITLLNNNIPAGDGINTVSLYTNRLAGTIEATNGAIELYDGLRIKFEGDFYHSDVKNKTFLVTGVGTGIQFKLLDTILTIVDGINSYDLPVEVYTDIVKHKAKVAGEFKSLDVKDYLVINKSDGVASGWSRANHWIHSSTLKYFSTLDAVQFDFPAIDINNILNSNNQAKRPIIEFDSYITMMNHGVALPAHTDDSLTKNYHGKVDYMLTAGQYPDSGSASTDTLAYTTVSATHVEINGYLIPINSIVAYNLDSYDSDFKLYIIKQSGKVDELSPLENNNTITVVNNLYDSQYNQSDYYIRDYKFVEAQPKLFANTAPLFRLKTINGNWLDDYVGSTFSGSKLFSYKLGNGAIDTELGFSLSYKDAVVKSEYEFENNLNSEKYFYLLDSSNIETEIKGYYFFNKRQSAFTNYIPSAYPLGSETNVQVIADSDNDVTIGYGYDNWRVEREFLIYYLNSKLTASEIITEGSYNRTRVQCPEFIMASNTDYTVHDLTPDQAIKFWDGETGEDIETVINHRVTVVRTDTSIILTATGTAGYFFYYGPEDETNRGLVSVVSSTDNFYHQVYMNGKHLSYDNYTVGPNAITIQSSELEYTKSNVIDLVYYSNSPSESDDIHIPESHTHNASNKVITTFTLSETLPHWKSIIETAPGFIGNSSGLNNYCQLPKIKSFGGEIFMHEDVSIMHDYSYSSNDMNISQALYEQGMEWYSFKSRLINQIPKTFAIDNYTDVTSLSNAVMQRVTNLYSGGSIHSDSDMAYAHPAHSVIYDYTTDIGFIYEFGKNISFNSDDFKSNHVYVYVEHNRDSDNIPVQVILEPSSEYIVVGNGIQLTGGLEVTEYTNGNTAKVLVFMHNMNEPSGIPASMAKLGLSNIYRPMVHNNRIICHDGSEYPINENTELFKVKSPNFDPTAAIIYDLEKKIYAGLKKDIPKSYNSPWKYMPSQHRGTWYSKDIVDNYIEHLFLEWKEKTKDSYVDYQRDMNSPWDWNYSLNDIYAGHLATGIPGHWEGAYFTLFGTSALDSHPWHMLGFSIKPDWWDNHYSWNDTIEKRTALLTALKYGIVSNPDDVIVQDLHYARYYWDWENNSPVDATGSMLAPNEVLGNPPEDQKMAKYDFGDWSYLERTWRKSALGQAALIDAVLKLNPTKAWTDFFQTNTFLRSPISDHMVHYEEGKFISPALLTYHGDQNGNMLANISIQNSDSGIPEGTKIIFIGGTDGIPATADLILNAAGQVTNINVTRRGNGYFNSPSYILEYPGEYISENPPTVNIKMSMQPAQYWVPGINQILNNYVIRNGFSKNLSVSYESLDTQLYQPIGGFTAHHLIDVETESGLAGKFNISGSDMKLVLNQEAVSDLIVASEIYIKKLDIGYELRGIHPNKQIFKFYTVKDTREYANVNLSAGGSLKKYKYFDSLSSYKFDTVLPRIQQAYDFIRGHYEYLETAGYSFSKSKEAKALEFAEWAMAADLNETYTVEIGTSIAFNPKFGVVLEYGTLPGGLNEILAYDEIGNVVAIDYTDLCITRTSTEIQIHPRSYPISSAEDSENAVSYTYQSSTSTQYQEYQLPGVVTTPTARNIACVASALTAYGHGMLINNTTQFNDVIFDDTKNQRHARLKITGQRSRDWDGSKTVPGYLVKNNTIIQNYDTAVSDVIDFYDLNVAKFNKDHTIAENLTVGNIARDWILKLGLPANVVAKFYQGVIRNKGTNSVVERIGRSNLINRGHSTINVYEEWMFNHSHYGDTIRAKATEIEINSSMVKKNPAIVDLLAANITYVNKETDMQFQMLPMSQVNIELPAAGNLQEGDARYTALGITDLNNIFDTSADYANYKTWSSRKPYRLGDTVRNQGDLWRANTNIAFLSSILPLEFSSTEIVSDILFKHRNEITDPDTPSAEIDGVKIWFDKEAYSYPDIVINSSINASVMSPANLIIDDIEIPLTRTVEQTIIDPDATNDGNPYAITEVNPSSNDVTGKILSFTTFVSGVSETSTVNLQLYSTAIYGTSIENLTGVTAQQTYTLSTSLSTNNITSLTVNSIVYNTPADWTASGQDITFINPVFVGSETITINFVSTVPTYTMNATQLKTAINSSVAGVTAIDAGTRVNIVMNALTVNDTFTVNAASGNTAFGITAGVYLPTTTIIFVDAVMDIDYILTQIELVNTPGYLIVKTIDNKLEITSFASTNWTTSTTLDIAGTARTQLSLPETTLVGTPGVVQVSCSASEAVTFINAANIPGVLAAVVSGKITIASSNTEIDLGDREFNNQATIPTGVYYADFGLSDNVFNISDWDLINNEDAGLFNVWIANDSGLTKSTTSNITSKYFGWNVLQTHSFRMWGEIEAGNDTDDGNDAKISLKSNTGGARPYPMAIGDYVMILNSTTQPNIDGIHCVTRVDPTDPSAFYIDRFIEKSGKCESVMVLRPSRFNTYADLETSTYATSYYDWKPGSYAWVTKDEYGVECNLVWKNIGPTTFELVYSNFDRIKDNQVESILIYDADKSYTLGEFELFDPLRGVIPGLADREIDQRSIVDLAVYNMSNDATYTLNYRGAWAKDQVGKVWWDTSKVKYYDYDQGTYEYRANIWGKQFTGSSIDVYEWTKSSVPPDEWETKVNASQEQFGIVASGTAYGVYDISSDDTLYYYTQEDEWNNDLARYEAVYYYWVKNKTTLTGDNRRLTVTEIANIINDPTVGGVAWYAPISSNVLILSNAGIYINDSSSILQITMKPEKGSHRSWIAISEFTDLIPDYWYIGLEDNLIGSQRKTGFSLPDHGLHVHNRYGDKRHLNVDGVSYAQGWFKDPWDARREAIRIINRLLINQNIVQDLRGRWDRILTQTFNIAREDTVFGIGTPEENIPNPELGATYIDQDGKMFVCISKSNTESVWALNPGFDMKNTWEWATYVAKNRIPDITPSVTVASAEELSLVDTNSHIMVRYSKPYNPLGLSQDEVYQWNVVTSEWELVEKENATIQFNDLVYNKNSIFAWDVTRWEGFWDFDPGIYMGYIIKACREDLFTGSKVQSFNELFFGMIRYVASIHNQVDWFYKTTYVNLQIDTSLIHDSETLIKKYVSSHVDEAVDYVNTVKPFHTKVRTIFDRHVAREELSLSIEEVDNVQKTVIMDFDTRGDVISINGDTYVANFSDGPAIDDLFGGDFADIVDDEFIGQGFNDPQNWNTYTESYRNTDIGINVIEQLSLKVLTTESGIYGTDARTYVYMVNSTNKVAAYSLDLEKSTTIVSDITHLDDTIVLDSGNAFAEFGGFVYINDEVIQYSQNINGTLYGLTRGAGNTMAGNHITGTQIIEISNSSITGTFPFSQDTFFKDGAYKSYAGYDVLTGESMFDGDSAESGKLQLAGQGIQVGAV